MDDEDLGIGEAIVAIAGGSTAAGTTGAGVAAGINAAALAGASYGAMSLMDKQRGQPKMRASKPVQTAAQLPQLSQQDALNRKMAASMLTKNWGLEPQKLGKAGVVGL